MQTSTGHKNIPANREWTENGESGLLVPCKDPESLAENIVKLLKDGNLRESLGMKAYWRRIQNFLTASYRLRLILEGNRTIFRNKM